MLGNRKKELLEEDGFDAFIAGLQDTGKPLGTKEHDYDRFIRVWRNERGAPEILQYSQDLVQNLRRRIEEQVNIKLSYCSTDGF